jgi:ribosomal protein S18 acetylase RimI-like enzyme
MTTPPTAETVATAMARTWALLARTLTQGWGRDVGGTVALVTGMPIPTLNGVWAVHEDTPAREIDAGLDAVAVEGFPYCLQVRASARERAAAIAEPRGMVAGPDIPLMWLADEPQAAAVDGLAIRQLTPAEATMHCEVAGPAFGAPPELLAQLITPEMLELAELRVYLGEQDGEAVVTAVSVTLGQGVGIFNVATPPDHRRRGYATAITARAVSDGFAGGASWAWLQSTEEGYGVYEAMGFETIERFPLWVSGS